jgi:Ca2+-binding EF-hand superfamily protein
MKPSSKRRKTGKSVAPGLTPSQESEIRSAFDMFTTTSNPDIIPTNKVKTAMKALGLDTISTSEMSAILSALDDEKTGSVEWDMFLQVMALKLAHEEESGNEGPERRQREIRRAFELFDSEGRGVITLSDLRRVAGVLGEDCSEEDLQEMIDEAAITRPGQVFLKDFEAVMLRAGVL